MLQLIIREHYQLVRATVAKLSTSFFVISEMKQTIAGIE